MQANRADFAVRTYGAAALPPRASVHFGPPPTNNHSQRIMKTVLSLALLSALALPLCAQRYEIGIAKVPIAIPQAPPVEPLPPKQVEPPVALQADLSLRRQGDLFAKLQVTPIDTPFVGVLIAALDGGTVQLPQLPQLLKADLVVATGVDIGGLVFRLGPAMFGFDVFVQGIALTEKEIAASKPERLAGTYQPAHL